MADNLRGIYMLKDKLGSFMYAAIFLAVLVTAGLADERLKCAQCGMPVDVAAPFSSKIVAGDQTLYFCDIGDLLVYLRERKTDPKFARVKDYRSGEWIEAVKAFYVHEPRRFMTPMGWGVASFKDKKDAEHFGVPSDITAVSRRLK
jgi:nitrous oxide reductase accessory protein NosL